MASNHSITDAVFFHWLKVDVLAILPLIPSRISLLILPISDLVELISLVAIVRQTFITMKRYLWPHMQFACSNYATWLIKCDWL